MGRSRYKIYEPQEIHFLTHTILQWIPIFTRPETVDIILDAFRYLQHNHHMQLYGYVILENHIHWVAKSENLPKDIHRFKSGMHSHAETWVYYFLIARYVSKMQDTLPKLISTLQYDSFCPPFP